MFNRSWSSVPKDTLFPHGRKDPTQQPTLEELGYCITESGHIRKISDKDKEYNYREFGNKHERLNVRLAFDFSRALLNMIHDRLMTQGLHKVLLPLGTNDPAQKHVPIFISPDIAAKSRVIIYFGNTTVDLGVLSYRAVQGTQGIDIGSMISAVRHLEHQASSKDDKMAPGILMPNMGQLLWWTKGRCALSAHAWNGVPRDSAVHVSLYIDPEQNTVRGNETPEAHAKYIFEVVVPKVLKREAKLDIIASGNSVKAVEEYLNSNFGKWSSRLNTVTTLGSQFKVAHITDVGYKQFKLDRSRTYIAHYEPVNTPISGPEGNPLSSYATDYGCPVFSAGEVSDTEKLFMVAHPNILDWIQEVALEEDYKNPIIVPAPIRAVYDPQLGVVWGNFTNNDQDTASQEQAGSQFLKSDDEAQKSEGHKDEKPQTAEQRFGQLQELDDNAQASRSRKAKTTENSDFWVESDDGGAGRKFSVVRSYSDSESDEEMGGVGGKGTGKAGPKAKQVNPEYDLASEGVTVRDFAYEHAAASIARAKYSQASKNAIVEMSGEVKFDDDEDMHDAPRVFDGDDSDDTDEHSIVDMSGEVKFDEEEVQQQVRDILLPATTYRGY